MKTISASLLKISFSFLILGLVLFLYQKAVAVILPNEILIQSLESRTNQNGPVYNKIKLIQQNQKEIWMMNQSHAGLTEDKAKWERLAIVIENKQVSFYQLEPGELEWSDDLKLKQVSYRASCFMCHNNGPRAIRADKAGLQVSWVNQLQIFFWNIKIKTYGRLSESSEMAAADLTRATPFKHRAAIDLKTLQIKACVKCHNENGRGLLTSQQAGTIQFMIKNNFMPPFSTLDKKDLKVIQRFTNGF